MSIKNKEIYVETVADLSGVTVGDGDLINILGYFEPGDGGGQLVRYDATASGTVDGGFILPGFGGSLSFNGTGVFNGVSGVGRFLAIDKSVANMKKFGSKADGTTDDDSILRNAMNAGAPEVLFPSGSYVFDNFVNLASDVKYCGEGMGKTVLKRTDGRRIFAISTYDFENFDTGTSVGDKRNIEIRDMTFDWNLISGWQDFAGLIQFAGADTGNNDTIEDVTISHCSWIDSQNVAHAGNDAWGINMASFAPVQRRVTIEHCKCLAEGHQFIAGGGTGWEDLTYRHNYVYHPRANGMTASTVSESGVAFRRIKVHNNVVVGPYSLGIWIGPDEGSDGGDVLYEDIVIEDNEVIFDSYTQGTSPRAYRINCTEGITKNTRIKGNTLTLEDDFVGGAVTMMDIVNGAGQTFTSTADFTQPTVGASGVISLSATPQTWTQTGIKVILTGGGIYTLNSISGADITVTRLDNFPSVADATVIPSGSTVEFLGTNENIFIDSNYGEGSRLDVGPNIDNATVTNNVCDRLQIQGLCKNIVCSNNTVLRIAVQNGHNTGIVKDNCFRQFDDSSGFGNIRISPDLYRGLATTDFLVYEGNAMSNQGETNIQNRFIFEAEASGTYEGRYYNNLGEQTLNRGIQFEGGNNGDRRHAYNIYSTANQDSYPASLRNMRFYDATLDFDLTSVESQTIVVSADGVNTTDIILIGVPNASVANGAIYTAQPTNNNIRVTASRADSTVGVDPGSGTFRFVAMAAR